MIEKYEYVGLTLKEAQAKAEKEQLFIRVISENNWIDNRLNVILFNGKIVEVSLH